MTYAEPRFECLPDKLGMWMVRANATHCLAELAGKVLHGREKQRAEAACSVLSKIYRGRLDASSVRQDMKWRARRASAS